jgi:hypothetical protein
MRFTASIELGVAGYRYSVEEFSGDTWQDLKAMIRYRLDQFSGELMVAQERNGDLRGYAPAFANGYPMIDCEPEIGEDFSACILDLRIDGVELAYHSRGYTQLRRELCVA